LIFVGRAFTARQAPRKGAPYIDSVSSPGSTDDIRTLFFRLGRRVLYRNRLRLRRRRVRRVVRFRRLVPFIVYELTASTWHVRVRHGGIARKLRSGTMTSAPCTAPRPRTCREFAGFASAGSIARGSARRHGLDCRAGPGHYWCRSRCAGTRARFMSAAARKLNASSGKSAIVGG
jgi:hypothetical protein